MTPHPTTPDGKPAGAPNAAPLWRKHFPIESAADAAQSRRGFLGGVAIAGGAMACCQALTSSDSTHNNDPENQTDGWTEHAAHTLDANFNELTVGQAIQFHFPDHRSPCLLVKLADDDFVAFSQKCTHLACPVIPEFENDRFHCPCHHGEFDLQTGTPTAGPPRRPLPKIRIEKQANGALIATATQT